MPEYDNMKDFLHAPGLVAAQYFAELLCSMGPRNTIRRCLRNSEATMYGRQWLSSERCLHQRILLLPILICREQWTGLLNLQRQCIAYLCYYYYIMVGKPKAYGYIIVSMAVCNAMACTIGSLSSMGASTQILRHAVRICV